MDTSSVGPTPILHLTGISKRYPLVLANDHIDLTLYPGEILALVGENGAGKSTLMKIIYGLVQPDQGTIAVQGQPVTIPTPTAAIRLGIGMVHQHFMLVEPLTVLENVILGLEPHRQGTINLAQARQQITTLVEELGFRLDLQARITDLPVGLRQQVEILKALYRQARILILDEPTAVLTPSEAQDLFAFLRRFVEKQGSVIFISHKLDEVLAVADRITVIRDGRVVTTVPRSQIHPQQLAEWMVGRPVVLTVPRTPAQPQTEQLPIEQLRLTQVTVTSGSRTVVDQVSFAVHQGEIVGIAGVEGNGQTELIEAITGLRPYQGHITYQGQVLPAQARPIRHWGLSHIPEDRNTRGLILDFPTRDNSILGDQDRAPFRGWLGFLHRPAIESHAQTLVSGFDVRPRSTTLTARRYSGGNAQKVIVGRELTRDPKILVAAQPTRGVDIGAIESIHRHILQARDQGMAVLLVSADLNEVIGLADRILVLHKGRIAGELANPPGSLVSVDHIGCLMAGLAPPP
ncbi:MAG: ABC transporter ATP-binding protein [Synechococcales cyanobacterium]